MSRSGDEATSVSKTQARITVTINEEFCKGCGLCVKFCPTGALVVAQHTNEKGFHPAAFLNSDACTGCAQCALMCPDACIKIVRTK